MDLLIVGTSDFVKVCWKHLEKPAICMILVDWGKEIAVMQQYHMIICMDVLYL